MGILNFERKKIPHIVSDLNQLTHDQKKYLQKQRPMICTPIRGTSVMGNYLLSSVTLAKWAEKIGMQVDTQMLFNCSYIEQGRNVLANTFWKSDCTHLVFIDSDNGFVVNNFFELLLTQKDIIGGVYTKRKINWEAVTRAVKAGVPPEMLSHCSGDFPIHTLPGLGVDIGHEPQKVLTMPTGFLSISRKCLETYVKAFPERTTTTDSPGHYGIQFFRAGTVDAIDEKGNKVRGFNSEDNLFCLDMRELGVDTWLAPWMHLTHAGEYQHDACFPCSNGAFVHLPGWVEAQKGSK